MVALGAWLVAITVGIICFYLQEWGGLLVTVTIWLFTTGIIIGVPKWSEFDEWKRLKKKAGEWGEAS